MATTNLYLDTRHNRVDGMFPLKLKVTLNGSQGFMLNLQTSLYPEQWDKHRGRVIKHQYGPDLNRYLQEKQNDVEAIIRSLDRTGELHTLRPLKIKERIVNILSHKQGDDKHPFEKFFSEFAATRNRENTREIYRQTLKRVIAFAGKELTFEDIDYSWLTEFEHHMQKQGLSQNTRDIQFRNIRAAFKELIRKGTLPTSPYPFDQFKHRQVTVPIDTFSIEQLKQFRDYPCEPHQQLYIDIFMLMFYLHGINIGDLLLLKPTDYRKGRIEFDRQKTGRHYSIKVEPEAAKIIDRYRGEQYLLNLLETWTNYRFFSSKMNRVLKQIGAVKTHKHGRKEREPFAPGLTTYWARRTFATIAYTDAEIPIDIIGQMLGHRTTNQITWRYIKTDQKKIDEANRKVLDLLL